jgi:HD-GYP domain-containing protein (c-di-GMP phosphodiesterase class II)
MAGLRITIEDILGIEIPSSVTIPLGTSPFYAELVKSSAARIITNQDIIEGLLGEILIATLGSRAAGKKISKMASMIYKQSKIQSLAVVPLISGNENIGLVDLFSTELISDAALGWLKTAADQLSGIIQRVQAETDRASSIKELELINRAVVGGSRLDDHDEICKLLADEVYRENPDAYVLVSLLDPKQQTIRIRALRGLGKLTKQLEKILGKNPQDVQVDVAQAALDNDLVKRFTSGKLELIPNGIVGLTRGLIPEGICKAIEKVLNINEIYIVGFGLHGESTGGLVLGIKEGAQIQFPAALETIANHFAEIIESRMVHDEVLERKKHLEALRSVQLDIASKLELEDLLYSIAEKSAEIVNASGSGFCVYNSQKHHLDYYAYTGFERLPEKKIIEIGKGLSGKVWESQKTIVVENYSTWPDRLKEWEEIGNYSLAGVPVCWGEESLGVMEIALPIGDKLSPSDISLLETFAVQAAIAIKNAQLFSSEKQKRQEAETLQEVGLMVNSHLERSELLDSILIALQKVVPYDNASIQIVQDEYVVIEAFRSEREFNGVIGKKFKISENFMAVPILKDGKNIILDDVSMNPNWIHGPETEGIHSWIAVPLQVKEKRIGLLTLDHKNIAQYQEKDANLALNFAAQAAIALENSMLFEDAKSRLFKIESLRQIDLAISGSVDLEISMSVLVRQLINSLDVDAATVLIFDDLNRTLKYIAGHGFVTDSLKYTSLRIGEGLAGKAAQRQELVYLKDIGTQETSLIHSPTLRKENFVSYIAVPLIAKGEIVGVLEVFHRSLLEPDKEWFNFLEALSGQAAIAIDRLNLFTGLEQSNLDLLRAYEATIEGWAKAIELRDRETEGHSRRVVDNTLRLAMRMGISGKDLLNMRRGALLHDVGKMAVPDHILLKPDKLSEDEWLIMKEHPTSAINLLSPIEYLQDALDIPCSHHERWDGKGYPDGLAGEEIPLSARIFAVIDVWDALQSDRPYRPGWSVEEALQYITENSGSHFDPDVVAEFLEMIKPDLGD